MTPTPTPRRHSPRRVADALKRYGISTNRSNGRRVYRDIGLEQLRRIERNYGIDLNTSGEDRPEQVQVRLY